MAWISTIRPRTSSSTSRRLSSRARPSSESTPLRIMAKDLQCEAEGGGWSTRGVRRRYGEQDVQRHVAQRHLCGDCQRVAAAVVLCYRALRHHLGGGSRIQIRGPNVAYLLARKGPGLGVVGRGVRAADAHQEHGGQEHQACQCDPGDAFFVGSFLAKAGLAIYGSSIRPSTRPCNNSSALHTKASGRCFIRPMRRGQRRPRTVGTT